MPSALIREHPALKKWNLLTFYIFVGHFCPPESGYGTTTLSGSFVLCHQGNSDKKYSDKVHF